MGDPKGEVPQPNPEGNIPDQGERPQTRGGPSFARRIWEIVLPRARAARKRAETEDLERYKQEMAKIYNDPEALREIFADPELRGRIAESEPELFTDLDAAGLLPPMHSADAALSQDDQQDPDRAYPQRDLVRDPRTGQMIPAREYLGDKHLTIRAQELIAQEHNPRPDPRPIQEKEVPKHAFDLLMSLQESVRLWGEPTSIEESDGNIIKTYRTTLENVEGDPEVVISQSELLDSAERVRDRKTSFTIQLVYPNRESTTPITGNLSIIKPTKGWQREYVMQAEPVPIEKGDKPLISYDDYPFHEESMGRPVENDFYALQRAKEMIAEVPRTT